MAELALLPLIPRIITVLPLIMMSVWILTGYGTLTTLQPAAITLPLIGNDAPAITTATPASLLTDVHGLVSIVPSPIPFRVPVGDVPMNHVNAPPQLLGPVPEVEIALAVLLRQGALGLEAHAT